MDRLTIGPQVANLPHWVKPTLQAEARATIVLHHIGWPQAHGTPCGHGFHEKAGPVNRFFLDLS